MGDTPASLLDAGAGTVAAHQFITRDAVERDPALLEDRSR